MLKRARELAEAAPDYFWAWWNHTPPPLIENHANHVVIEDDPEPKRQRSESPNILEDVDETETDCGPWGGALALLETHEITEDFLPILKRAIDNCMDGAYESDDVKLVEHAMEARRALTVANDFVVSHARGMTDASQVPEGCKLVYEFVQLEGLLRRAFGRTRVVAN